MSNPSNERRGERWIEEALKRLRDENLERSALPQQGAGGNVQSQGGVLLNFSSNDYLDLARSELVLARAESYLRRWGAGACASRLISGTLPCHDELEQRLAANKGYPAALVFGSGYMTNAGILPALLGRSDYIIADRLAHASIMDSAMLSRATLLRFRHNDVEDLEALLKRVREGAKKLIATESVFSMDGDLAPISEIAELASRSGAMLLIDEAHATGVFGRLGAGLVREASLEGSVNISMGTLSKALGGYGGFAACSENMRRLLVNKARSFIFSTGIPPAAVGAALGALDAIEASPGLGADLLARAAKFRGLLLSAGLDTGNSSSQIIPIMVGENAKALALSARLKERGIMAPAIRPPTVPVGTARLRLSVTLAHSEEDLADAAEAIIDAAKEEGVL